MTDEPTETTEGTEGFQVPMLPHGPVPSVVSVQGIRTNDGQGAVQVFVSSPMGLFTFFMPSKNAKDVAKAIADNAEKAASGLIVPPGAVAPNSPAVVQEAVPMNREQRRRMMKGK